MILPGFQFVVLFTVSREEPTTTSCQTETTQTICQEQIPKPARKLP